ncbi:MAG: hypothetical protein M3328_16235, partial [Chloroflexota bacterium]|nr:hypothetical protein [Chloroflexota bacterium]
MPRFAIFLSLLLLSGLAIAVAIGNRPASAGASARVTPGGIGMPAPYGGGCVFTTLSFGLSGTGSMGATRPFSVTAGDTFAQFIAPPITATDTSQGFAIVNTGFSGNLSGGITGTFTLTNLNALLITRPEGSTNQPRGLELNEIVINGASGTITAAIALNSISFNANPPYYPQTFNGYLHSTATSGSYSGYSFWGGILGNVSP